MKTILILFLFLIPLINVKSQVYGERVKYKDFGVWTHRSDNNSVISVHAYIMRVEILEDNDGYIKQKTLNELPRYRYEMVLTSRSEYKGKITTAWLYNVRIYVEGKEVTKSMHNDGFIASIDTKPTTVYYYNTNKSDINFKITWETSVVEPRNE